MTKKEKEIKREKWRQYYKTKKAKSFKKSGSFWINLQWENVRFYEDINFYELYRFYYKTIGLNGFEKWKDFNADVERFKKFFFTWLPENRRSLCKRLKEFKEGEK